MIRLFITTLVVVLTSMSVFFAGSYKMANIVCFVKFADEADKAWEHDFDYYDNMFNSTEGGRELSAQLLLRYELRLYGLGIHYPSVRICGFSSCKGIFCLKEIPIRMDIRILI